MEKHQNTQQLPPPPGVINALKAGLDAISSHLSVLLLPLALDGLLWFGPRLSVKELFTSTFDWMIKVSNGGGFTVEEISTGREHYIQLFQSFNLLSFLRTFPIGVSSLMTAKMPIQTPLGVVRSVIEVRSEDLFGWILLLTLIGWAMGGLYFSQVSGVTVSREIAFGPGRALTQTLLFSLGLTVLSFMVGVPIVLVLAVINLISPVLVQVAMFVLALISAWIIVPIFFAPHGIYLHGQNAIYSIYTSLRMARFTLPTSSMFVLAVFIISQVLNYLWSVPPEESWMLLVGIAGHAFVTTALLAASFIYYRDMNAWLEIVFERLKPRTAAPQT
jgi:hypothetical protein